MNDNFNRVLKESGMSMYALSMNSGVPYTTINEIHNGKVDINQCAAQTVWKLGTILKTDPGEIMNPIMYMDGIRGRYGDIDYVWETDETSKIVFEYQGDKVTLDMGALYNIPDRIKYYQDFAKWKIKDFIEDIEWHEEARKILDERMGKK